jgi:hypothetical protein
MQYFPAFSRLIQPSFNPSRSICLLPDPDHRSRARALITSRRASLSNLYAALVFYIPFNSIRQMSAVKRKAEPPTASSLDLKKPKKDASLTSFFGAPKAANMSTKSAPSSSPTETDPTPIKFDKDKWVRGLSGEQRELLKLEIDTLDPSWLAYLREDVLHSDFLELKRFLQREIDSGKKIFPPLEDVYSW